VRKMVSLFLGVLAAAALIAPAAMAEEKESKGGKDDGKIALDQVPAAVKAAAEQAVTGIVLTEAKKKTKDGKVIYELAGKVGDKSHKIKVDADGKVLNGKQAEGKAEELTGEKYGKDKKEKKEQDK